VNRAIALKSQKCEIKITKAVKLFQKALSLNPDDSYALSKYGEYLSEIGDKTQAAEMYHRAFLNSNDKTYETCRNDLFIQLQESNKIVLAGLDRQLQNLHFQIIDSISRSDFNKFSKKMFVEQVYHSVAIEGNTLKFNQVKKCLKSDRIPRNFHKISIKEVNEILGVADAFQYANWTVYRQIQEVAETGNRDYPRMLNLELIRDLHLRIIGRVDPGIAGVYRKGDVFVSGYKPPSAGSLMELMSDFEGWLLKMEYECFIERRVHPIQFAAESHYRLVKIHPYQDGNGRLSRLLMNLILMRAGYPPTLIKVSDRQRYFKALDYDHLFQNYIIKATRETLLMYFEEFNLDSNLNSIADMKDEL